MQVAELFHSIQGEGSLAGTPSAFVRLAGCNLRCAWCDTSYASWKPEATEMAVEEVVAEVSGYPTRYCVVTGGEPMMADGIHELARRLHDLGKHVTIETNGTVAPEGIHADLASLSPKLGNSVADAGKFPSEFAMQCFDRRWKPDVLRAWIDRYDYQLKFVVATEQDLAEARQLLKRLERDIPPERIMLMPLTINESREAAREQQKAVAEMCKTYGYRYCHRLQQELYGSKRGT